ncbi:hypothetical protein [Streptomyces albidoflavus]|uniref:hypothetical protein n=1 Tax=Streptomyces albidoflavus TaxID=1886 RepID=UPI001F5D15BB|nr:hypothetical protein [Streptomyces albidoflavus]
MTLNPQVSAHIRDYRPRLPAARWEPVSGQVRAVVTAVAPATCDIARRLLYVVSQLAVWADSVGLPRDPALWLRTETIDRFVLSGPAGRPGGTAQSCRCRPLRTREAVVRVQRGEAPPIRIKADRWLRPPYEEHELAALRRWVELLPGRARLDGLALMALATGCGLAPDELRAVRGHDLRTTSQGLVLVDAPWLDRLVACRAEWEVDLTNLAELAGNAYLFRPGRKVEAAKNLVSSWSLRHRPHAGLLHLEAHRLRTTWIVGLLRQRVDPVLIAQAAGMRSVAALFPYFHWVPPHSPEQAAEPLRGARP